MCERFFSSQKSGFVETLEGCRLMGVVDISVGSPPTTTETAVVVRLSQLDTQTGRPHTTVTVNPPTVLAIPDKAPPPPPPIHDLVVVKVVDKSSANLF